MIVANRSLQLRQGKNNLEAAVRIFVPERDQSAWTCSFEIDWPEGTRKGAAVGFDSIQALLLALQMIGAEIYTSEYHKSGALSWSEPRRGYGFPVMPSMRDMLIGDDAKYL